MDRIKVLQRPAMVCGRINFLSSYLEKEFWSCKWKALIVLLWIHLPSLPLQMLNDRVSRHILSPIGKLIKIDHKSEEMSEGLFACVWVEVNVIKPLKRKLKYFDEGFFYECLPHYENITNICFRCGSQFIILILVCLILKALLLKLRNHMRFLRSMNLWGYVWKETPILRTCLGWKFPWNEP